ncbi:MAG: hypothetical protein Kow0090_04550 [Myxococcota bacterium]
MFFVIIFSFAAGAVCGIYFDRFSKLGAVVDSAISAFYSPQPKEGQKARPASKIEFGEIPFAADYAPAREIDRNQNQLAQEQPSPPPPLAKSTKRWLPGKNLIGDMQKLNDCFSDARARTPSIAKTAKLIFELDGNSRLGNIEVQGAGEETIKLTECIKRRMESMDIISSSTKAETFYVILSETN